LKSHLNYARLRFLGSCVLAVSLAAVVAFIIFKFGDSKPELLSLFFPIFIFFTWLILRGWGIAQERSDEHRRQCGLNPGRDACGSQHGALHTHFIDVPMPHA
jgi:hypothetical protein